MTESCDLCGDVNAPLFLHARCHPTAPLRVIKEGDVLILRCYLPDCDREVVRLTLSKNPAPVQQIIEEMRSAVRLHQSLQQAHDRPIIHIADDELISEWANALAAAVSEVP